MHETFEAPKALLSKIKENFIQNLFSKLYFSYKMEFNGNEQNIQLNSIKKNTKDS